MADTTITKTTTTTTIDTKQDDDDDEARRKEESFEYTKSFLLGKRIKTTLSDGRTLTGIFICIDRLKNLILTNVIEERYIDPSDYNYREQNDNETNNNETMETMDRTIKVERQISQAMIPGSRLVKAELLTGTV
eukprot:CAMPEP_0116150424 /NCGR_PEP_ID=MMETSP0329-20121206/19539_1 /TAXON_ID=697910 /ORGANISM="Pseudo-nitzschia arenysensis, Strain B593" /LENGTH=133 /DNA_ID=CAMNT_0003646935 /DNA_START=51 /DNA_END=452 /DNA_ORIENTATION=+